jgi:hypothetical protein
VSDTSFTIGDKDFASSGQIDDVRVYNYPRTPAQVAWDYNRGRPQGWWKFDECTGTKLHDASGNGNDGNWAGTTTMGNCQTANTAWGNGASGKFNASLNFASANNDYVLINSAATLNFTNQMTVAAWVNAATIDSTYRRIVSRNHFGGPSQSWYMEFDGTNIGRINYAAGNASFTGNTVLQTGRWYQVVMTYDGSNIKLYIDGKLDSSAPSSGAILTAGNIGIGADDTNGSNWNGKIDDVRIYNYALTLAQIKLLYNGDAAVRFSQ